jgi:hypothetical protein
MIAPVVGPVWRSVHCGCIQQLANCAAADLQPCLQNALVHEHIVQLLSQPQNVTKYTTIEVNGRPLELNGYACAHWAALCFVTRIASPRGDLLKHLADYDDESVRELKQRCALSACRLHCNAQMRQGYVAMVAVVRLLL